MLEAELVTDVERLAELAPSWDALASACALPQMSPAWLLAWWRHVAPPSAVPRTVVVRDGADVVAGVAPFYVDPSGRGRVDYRLPGIEIAGRLAPLALPGREWEVAEATARTLADAVPRPDALLFEGTPIDAHWLAALRERWPGALRPSLWRTQIEGSPFVSLREGSYEDWLAAKSSNFRRQAGKLGRRFERAGGTSRLATRATLADDAAAFTRLHAMRWAGRGTTNLVRLGDRFTAMLVDVGETQLETGGFALRVLELDGEPISVQILISAGGCMLVVNGGWDERHAYLRPSLLSMLLAVRYAFERGEQRLDLGVGEQPYKQRFADGDAPLEWTVLMAPTRRMPLTAARTTPALVRSRARAAALRGLSEHQLERLRDMQARLRRDAV